MSESWQNLDIRILVKENNIKYADIAKHMGINRVYLSYLMRYKLSEKNRERILQAIQEMTDERVINVSVKCLCQDCAWWRENGACNNFGGVYMRPDEFCSQAVRRSNK